MFCVSFFRGFEGIFLFSMGPFDSEKAAQDKIDSITQKMHETFGSHWRCWSYNIHKINSPNSIDDQFIENFYT